jgi:predicted lipoprotein with Yx(FWY)xxD motif
MAFGISRLRLITTAIVTVFGVVAAGAAAGPVAVNGPHSGAALVTVKTVKNGSLGAILVSASGRTLYHYASEKKNSVKCIGPCATTWLPYYIGSGAKPIAAPGVTAKLLGTVKRPDGKLQVTYGGLPLYLFTGDKKAGDVKGQGDGGSWYALAPTGIVVKKTVATTSGSTGGKTSGSSSSGSSGSTGSTSGGTTGGTGSSGTSVNCDLNPEAQGCGM